MTYTMTAQIKNNFLKGIIIITIYYVIVFLFTHNYLLTNDLPINVESISTATRAYQLQKGMLLGWNDLQAYGFPMPPFTVSGGLPSIIIAIIDAALFHNIIFTLKFLIFLFFLLTGYAMYIFLYSLEKSHLNYISASIAALSYISWNYYVIEYIVDGHPGFLLPYFATPLIFYCLLKYVDTSKIKYAIIASLLHSFSILSHPQLIIYLTSFIVLFL